MRPIYSIIERAAHQEFEGQIVCTFGLFPIIVELRVIPVELGGKLAAYSQ